jgi:DHA2 family multidrug resistance protein
MFGSSPIYQNRLKDFAHLFTSLSSPADAQIQAIGEASRILNQQARLYSYVDDFRYMALACFVCVPLVWTLKRIRRRAAVMEH